MDIEALAAEFETIVNDLKTRHSYDYKQEHGLEWAPGWFNLYNEVTGQSKWVLLHMESGLVFKHDYSDVPMAASRRYIGDVNFNGTYYPVRLPEFYVIKGESWQSVTAQEYCVGTHCGCVSGGWCDHVSEMVKVTNCRDAHFGNWKIVGNEIVLFDFEGIVLD